MSRRDLAPIFRDTMYFLFAITLGVGLIAWRHELHTGQALLGAQGHTRTWVAVGKLLASPFFAPFAFAGGPLPSPLAVLWAAFCGYIYGYGYLVEGLYAVKPIALALGTFIYHFFPLPHRGADYMYLGCKYYPGAYSDLGLPLTAAWPLPQAIASYYIDLALATLMDARAAAIEAWARDPWLGTLLGLVWVVGLVCSLWNSAIAKFSLREAPQGGAEAYSRALGATLISLGRWGAFAPLALGLLPWAPLDAFRVLVPLAISAIPTLYKSWDPTFPKSEGLARRLWWASLLVGWVIVSAVPHLIPGALGGPTTPPQPGAGLAETLLTGGSLGTPAGVASLALLSGVSLVLWWVCWASPHVPKDEAYELTLLNLRVVSVSAGRVVLIVLANVGPLSLMGAAALCALLIFIIIIWGWANHRGYLGPRGGEQASNAIWTAGLIIALRLALTAAWAGLTGAGFMTPHEATALPLRDTVLRATSVYSPALPPLDALLFRPSAPTPNTPAWFVLHDPWEPCAARASAPTPHEGPSWIEPKPRSEADLWAARVDWFWAYPGVSGLIPPCPLSSNANVVWEPTLGSVIWLLLCVWSRVWGPLATLRRIIFYSSVAIATQSVLGLAEKFLLHSENFLLLPYVT